MHCTARTTHDPLLCTYLLCVLPVHIDGLLCIQNAKNLWHFALSRALCHSNRMDNVIKKNTIIITLFACCMLLLWDAGLFACLFFSIPILFHSFIYLFIFVDSVIVYNSMHKPAIGRCIIILNGISMVWFLLRGMRSLYLFRLSISQFVLRRLPFRAWTAVMDERAGQEFFEYRLHFIEIGAILKMAKNKAVERAETKLKK